jgi:hypothetical protein
LKVYVPFECESDKDVFTPWKLDVLKPRVIPLIERPKVRDTDGKLVFLVIDKHGKGTEIGQMPSHIQTG